MALRNRCVLLEDFSGRSSFYEGSAAENVTVRVRRPRDEGLEENISAYRNYKSISNHALM